jgi:hypothetical protein
LVFKDRWFRDSFILLSFINSSYVQSRFLNALKKLNKNAKDQESLYDKEDFNSFSQKT